MEEAIVVNWYYCVVHTGKWAHHGKPTSTEVAMEGLFPRLFLGKVSDRNTLWPFFREGRIILASQGCRSGRAARTPDGVNVNYPASAAK